jgi:hypothetical protein
MPVYDLQPATNIGVTTLGKLVLEQFPVSSKILNTKFVLVQTTFCWYSEAGFLRFVNPITTSHHCKSINQKPL